MVYRGYDLEQKKLMVGWQIIITRDGAYVRNGAVANSADAAIVEARAYVDALVSPRDAAGEGTS